MRLVDNFGMVKRTNSSGRKKPKSGVSQMETSLETKKSLCTIIENFPGLDSQHRRAILQAVRQDSGHAKMLKMSEVCEILQVSRQTVQKWIKAGKIKQIRRSQRLIRFNAAEVEALAFHGMPTTTEKEGEK